MLKNLLIDWEFVKSIKKCEKPCFSDKTFVNMNEWFATWKRRRKGEIGENGVIYLNNLIKTTKDYCESIDDSLILKQIKDILVESLLGINNLVYTYQIDSQENVAKEYSKCILNVKNIINMIENKKTNFFINQPKIISNYKNK